MIFAPPLHRVVETVDRRVLGAIQFVDAVTRLPVAVAAKAEVRSAVLFDGGTSEDLPVTRQSVQLRQNRSGFQVIMRAPLFDEYASSFDNVQDPPASLAGKRLRLRMVLRDAGPHYLPRQFEFELPRPVDRGVPENVFQPGIVPLFRAPGAPVLGGWAVLRVRVTELGSNNVGLPGVLVRVFRSPRGPNDSAIGQGMTEWRGRLRGEALVAIAEVPRFRPGAGVNVFETTQAVHLEATRDPNFTGADDEFPGLPGITPGTISGRSDDPPANPGLTVRPVAPLTLRADQETSVEIEMP